MSAAFSKAEIESAIAGQFGDAFKLQQKVAGDTISSGIPAVDALIGGIPRGAISEIFGPASSGRTSLLLSMLSYATTHDEICALVDTNDVFAPTAAAPAGIDFDRLLWIRCAANIERAFKATDLLLHAGGFGLVILDLGDVAGKDARRIISSWWYRFRRTVENKPTAIIVMSEEACTRSCATVTLELNGAAAWVRTNELENPGVPIRGSEKGNVFSIRHSPASKLVTQANLLRINSIKIKQRRPITGGLHESQFSVGNFY
jgi:recombination protein RecA